MYAELKYYFHITLKTAIAHTNWVLNKRIVRYLTANKTIAFTSLSTISNEYSFICKEMEIKSHSRNSLQIVLIECVVSNVHCAWHSRFANAFSIEINHTIPMLKLVKINLHDLIEM